MSANDEFLSLVHRRRNVRVPCDKCSGLGGRWYSSGSTWRGGMGTARCEHDVCDACWGSGDASRPWTNIREVEKHRRAWESEQCAMWLAQRVGANFGHVRDGLAELLAVIEKESRRRKLPAGVDMFWYARTCETIASVLRELTGERKEGEV